MKKKAKKRARGLQNITFPPLKQWALRMANGDLWIREHNKAPVFASARKDILIWTKMFGVSAVGTPVKVTVNYVVKEGW